MINWDSPLGDALGARSAKRLAGELDVHTVGELLGYIPRRYLQRGQLTDLSQLRAGDHVTVLAQVRRSTERPMRAHPGRRYLDVVVTDGHGDLTLRFFGQTWQRFRLPPGARGLFAGQVTAFGAALQLHHPAYRLLDEPGWPTDAALPATGTAAPTAEQRRVGDDGAEAVAFAGALVPVYPATARLRSWTIAELIARVLAVLDPVADPVPAELLTRRGLLGRDAAVRRVHQPRSQEEAAAARRRLAYDEAVVRSLAYALRRQRRASRRALPCPARPRGALATFDALLDQRFPLTPGQRRVGEEIAADLARAHPMQRLLQGEVGSGKTVVALRAMLSVLDAGGQAALLAPTEVLAAQHLRSLRGLLSGWPGDGAPSVELLTAGVAAGRRREVLAGIGEGRTGIVVGTHALLEPEVRFARLGLVVVDEQHRFGVEQRHELPNRESGGVTAHHLSMTATPIPRTVALLSFGDLDVSSLLDSPPGRLPIRSHLVPAGQPSWMRRMWALVREQVAAGGQVFVVCPRIDVSGGDGPTPASAGGQQPDGDEPDGAAAAEAGGGATVTETHATLQAGPLAGLRLAALHGRLPAPDREEVMARFTAGEVDVLVATTVVEVGVDVPRASVMVVLDADRFGLNQLHQLRGRVGRGGQQAWCLLHTAAAPGSTGWSRVQTVAEVASGAELALADLALRGEGDLLGVLQSGSVSHHRLLDPVTDADLIAAAHDDARWLTTLHPEQPGGTLGRASLAASYLDKA